MSTPPTKSVVRWVFPTTLRAKVCLECSSILLDYFASLLILNTSVLPYTLKCFLDKGLGLASFYWHVLEHLHFFSLRRYKMKLSLCFLRQRSSYLKFFGWRTRTLKRWVSSSFSNFLNLHLFNSNRGWFVYNAPANRYVSFCCSLVEISLTVRTGDICKHGAARVNINVLASSPGSLKLIIYFLVCKTARSDMLSFSLRCNWSDLTYTFLLWSYEGLRKCFLHHKRGWLILNKRVIVRFGSRLCLKFVSCDLGTLLRFGVESKIRVLQVLIF